MAINLLGSYGSGNVDPATADYPYGTPKNVTAPSAGDGTPWEKADVSDIWGFFWAILGEAGIIPSGTADTAVNSEMLDGLKAILLERGELFPLVGAPSGAQILSRLGNRFPRNHREGLWRDRDSGVLMTLNTGSARNLANTADIDLSSPMQKSINVNWTDGGIGGLAEGLTLTPSWWYRHYVARSADGTKVTHFWDDDVLAVATNFFAGSLAAAAGYTDNTLFRRIGWTWVDSGSSIQDVLQSEGDPTINLWDDPNGNLAATGPSTGSRDVFNFWSHGVPPSCYFMGAYSDWNSGGGYRWSAITQMNQSDYAPGDSGATQKLGDKDNLGASTLGEWLVDENCDLGLRVSQSNDQIRFFVHGWRDTAIIP